MYVNIIIVKTERTEQQLIATALTTLVCVCVCVCLCVVRVCFMLVCVGTVRVCL